MKTFWNKIYRIFVKQQNKPNTMSNTKHAAKIRSTKDGQLYIDREDFFLDPTVRETISSILNSKSVKKVLAKTNGGAPVKSPLTDRRFKTDN